MKTGLSKRLLLLLGCFSGMVLTLLIVAIIAYIYIIAIQGTRVTNLQNYYVDCQKYYEQEKIAPETTEDLINFCKKTYPDAYPFWKPLEDGSIKYYRLSDDTWAILSLDGAPGFVLTERIKAGHTFHQRWIRRMPYKIEDSPEMVLLVN